MVEIFVTHLYRKIIEPLRDKGVIIASCSKGYKIPTSLADISAYIHQTTSIVGPMLNRIDICRKFIKKGSLIEIDVFDDPSLEAYKRYFGEY